VWGFASDHNAKCDDGIRPLGDRILCGKRKFECPRYLLEDDVLGTRALKFG
jgi:hypothetical protein